MTNIDTKKEDLKGDKAVANESRKLYVIVDHDGKVLTQKMSFKKANKVLDRWHYHALPGTDNRWKTQEA